MLRFGNIRVAFWQHPVLRFGNIRVAFWQHAPRRKVLLFRNIRGRAAPL